MRRQHNFHNLISFQDSWYSMKCNGKSSRNSGLPQTAPGAIVNCVTVIQNYLRFSKKELQQNNIIRYDVKLAPI